MEILYFIGDILFYIPNKFNSFLATLSYEFEGKNIGFYICIALSSVLLFAITRYKLGQTAMIKSSITERQKLAKSKVAWLNFVFCSVIVLISWLAYALFSDIARLSMGLRDSRALGVVFSLGIVAIIFVTFIIKVFFTHNSISSMASMLNAEEITLNTARKTSDKILLNIVEEMALASRMRMPRVFIMRDEEGVNVMASGENFGKDTERVAIFVTQGAMKTFNREEMQGVIGHEFSHAFHGDVELNIKLIAVISALGVISLIGKKIITNIRHTSSSREKNSGVAVIILIAVLAYGLGSLGGFFAGLIQSAISRQKEFLADATSARYTRNPMAIKKALSKLLMIQKFGKVYNDGIYYKDLKQSSAQNNQNFANKFDKFFKQKNKNENNQEKSANFKNIFTMQNLNAKNCSHMFFLPAFTELFATHPSLEDRIRKLKNMGA